MTVSLLEKPASALQETDIRSLLSDAVPESLTLDYKQEIGLDQKANRKEFAADASALPIKADVRRRAGIVVGDEVAVTLELI